MTRCTNVSTARSRRRRRLRSKRQAVVVDRGRCGPPLYDFCVRRPPLHAAAPAPVFLSLLLLLPSPSSLLVVAILALSERWTGCFGAILQAGARFMRPGLRAPALPSTARLPCGCVIGFLRFSRAHCSHCCRLFRCASYSQLEAEAFRPPCALIPCTIQ